MSAARRPPTRWYLDRARAMTPAELAWRLQAVATRPAREALNRSPTLPTWRGADWIDAFRGFIGSDDAELVRTAERIASGELRFWGNRVAIDLRDTEWTKNPLAAEPGWADDPKALWELHRHQHLVPLAAGAAVAEREELARLAVAHLLDWIEQNRRAPGPAWTSAYETAHRLVSWALAVPMLLPYTTASERLNLSTSFGQQCVYAALRPSRFSSANNHRLAELTGLLAGAAMGAADLHWERLWCELERETVGQTFSDGGSREQAAGYFLYVLEILSTAAFFASATGRSLGRLEERLAAMVGWLRAVAGADGEPPPVGDDAEDRMLRVEYFADRRASAIAARVPTTAQQIEDDSGSGRSRVLEESGYAVLRANGVRVVFDIGNLGLGRLAAHGHADALAVLVDAGEAKRLRDSGTGTYVAGEIRDWLRGTEAHNTVVVDGTSQARARGPHLWGRRFETTLEAVELGSAFDAVRARHDGYPGAAHARSVVFVKPDLLIVLDRVTAAEARDATLVWQLHDGAQPDLAVHASPPGSFVAGRGLFSPRYGIVADAPRATWTTRGRSIEFVSVISFAGASPAARLDVSDRATRVEVDGAQQVRIVERWHGGVADVESQ